MDLLSLQKYSKNEKKDENTCMSQVLHKSEGKVFFKLTDMSLNYNKGNYHNYYVKAMNFVFLADRNYHYNEYDYCCSV